MTDLIEIDGAQGEGGGQILRTSLALSAITGRPLRIFNIRAGRKKPGLLRQHLTAVQAAARVSAAQLEGDEPGSRELCFRPGAIQHGTFRFAVGSAGSATLVFQTILPILLKAPGPSEVRVEGGTHNPMAPPFDFLAYSFLPHLRRMGVTIEAELERAGFFPAGGGAALFRVSPAGKKARLKASEPGAFRNGRARIILAKLEDTIASREAKVIGRRLGWPAEIVKPPSVGPGNVVVLLAEHENVTNVFTSFGQKGKPAEKVAQAAAETARDFLETGATACEYLADQLLLPLALLGGGSYSAAYISEHTTTNIDVIRTFLDVRIEITAEDKRWRIDVEPALEFPMDSRGPSGKIDGR